jgi:hypothetical protein
VVFSEGLKYYIATALDLTFLQHIDLGMERSDSWYNLVLTQE